MRIFLAGTQTGMSSKEREEVFKESPPLYILETFFSGESACLKALNRVGKENFLLDSGAFSYMNGAKCTKEILLDYLDRYIVFINKYDIKYFFELDVDTIFGIEFVEMMRKKLETETNKKCIPVWHKGRGIEYWKYMVANYKYVAIGGLVFHVKKQEWPLIKKMVDYAYSKGVKVHGLGFTKTKILEEYKFYSVDSASWVRAAGMGQQIHFFDGKAIYARPLDKGNKKTYGSKLAAHNFKEWVKYQKYMNIKKWK